MEKLVLIDNLFCFFLFTAIIAVHIKNLLNQRVLQGSGTKFYSKPNTSFLWVGYICIICGYYLSILLLYRLWLEGFPTKSLWIPLFPIFIFILPGELLLIWYFNHQLIFDDREIIVTNWLGKRKETNWERIVNIKFCSTLGYIFLITKSETLKFHYRHDGLLNFLILMELKTKFRVIDLKIPRY